MWRCAAAADAEHAAYEELHPQQEGALLWLVVSGRTAPHLPVRALWRLLQGQGWPPGGWVAWWLPPLGAVHAHHPATGCQQAPTILQSVAQCAVQ